MFKPGDKLVCIDVKPNRFNVPTILVLNKEYTYEHTQANGGIKVKEFPSHAFFPHRFRLADPPITEMILKGLL